MDHSIVILYITVCDTYSSAVPDVFGGKGGGEGASEQCASEAATSTGLPQQEARLLSHSSRRPAEGL